MLAKYKVILWDFDGVILDSAVVREKGFTEVLSTYPADQVDRLVKYHRDNGGLSRYVKFRYFHEEVLGQAITPEQVDELAGQFSEVMLKHLTDTDLLIQEAVAYIKQHHQTVRMHIVSGSDQRELRFLCKQLGIDGYFHSIHGSPTPKKQLVKEVVADNAYAKENICLIGDSGNDYDAARENGIDFLGYNNTALRGKGRGYLDQFSSAAHR